MINAVSSSAGAAAQTLQQPRPQQSQDQYVDTSKSANASKSADEAARARQIEQQKRPEQAKPVLNAEGQKTGQVINVTA